MQLTMKLFKRRVLDIILMKSDWVKAKMQQLNSYWTILLNKILMKQLDNWKLQNNLFFNKNYQYYC